MHTGKIHLYDAINGIGLVIAADSGEELPFHRRDIAIDLAGPRVLNAGQAVEFDIREGQDGRQATNIHVSTANADIGRPDAERSRSSPSR